MENGVKKPERSWLMVLTQPARVYFISQVEMFSNDSRPCFAKVPSEIKPNLFVTMPFGIQHVFTAPFLVRILTY